jgi:radical SAM superfamily enzyme YgiQ (UPF0313 family)
MHVKMILPALTEAHGSFWRPIKYSLFPPLGLATLAAYLPPDDEVEIRDEHVETLDLDDRPDLVVIQVYITSAYRAYEIADHYRRRGAYVCLGGLHVTALPWEALRHADSIFLGPGEDTWPAFLRDFRHGRTRSVYRSVVRDLDGLPPVRRDLIKRELYLTPNTLVVSRGCPHACDFCYKDNFYRGGRSYYHQKVDQTLAEIDRLPGRHLYFLDDNLFADNRFCQALFEGMKGMGRVWQAAGTVRDVQNSPLMEMAAACGLKSLFIGFESIRQSNLDRYNKFHNRERDYGKAIRRLHRLGIMINASFVFGMDHDDSDVFRQTVDWAVANGIETATFHILTPYPGTRLYDQLKKEGRIRTGNWDLYDTRHAVFRPAGMTPAELEDGYWSAYREFYKWSSIFSAAWSHETFSQCVRHMALAAGWKKLEPLWSWVIRKKQLRKMIPLLEAVLSTGKSGLKSEAGAAVIKPLPASSGLELRTDG